jgi:hypothetical protein
MPTEIESMLVSVAEFQRTRHFGKYRGIVRNISDPLNQCRIKASVPAIYDDVDSPWALPSFPFAGAQHGLVLLPEVGDGVWLEFEGGDISRPIWSGCWFASGQRPPPQGQKARLLATSAGHQVLIDEDRNEIVLRHAGGAEIRLSATGVTLSMLPCVLEITSTEITLNNGMVKVTTAGASLVNDAFKVGA